MNLRAPPLHYLGVQCSSIAEGTRCLSYTIRSSQLKTSDETSYHRVLNMLLSRKILVLSQGPFGVYCLSITEGVRCLAYTIRPTDLSKPALSLARNLKTLSTLSLEEYINTAVHLSLRTQDATIYHKVYQLFLDLKAYEFAYITTQTASFILTTVHHQNIG